MKKPVRIAAMTAAAVILIAAICVAMSKQSCYTPVYRIFGSLSEFSCFDNYETEELPDPADMPEELTISDRRCFTVSFEGYDFNVYAYVFSAAGEAEAFAERYRQEDHSDGVLYDVSRDNRALLVTGGDKRSAQFLKYLFDNLTVNVDYPSDGERN